MPAIEIGQIEAIFRYPVKSMRAEKLDSASLGWHGLEGDRRLALRRVNERGGMPWLTAGRLPELVCFTPVWSEEGKSLPTHVRTPEGAELPVFGDALAADVERRHGAPVQMMHLNHGIFDDASISVIASSTVGEIGRLAGTNVDVRRFRPNLLVSSTRAVPFEEDEWVGGMLTFGGEGADAPAIQVTLRDLRCAMVNIDPDAGTSAPEVLKACARGNNNYAGVYSSVTRTGRLAVGQTIFFTRSGGLVDSPPN